MAMSWYVSLWTKDPTWRDIDWSDVQYTCSQRQMWWRDIHSLPGWLSVLQTIHNTHIMSCHVISYRIVSYRIVSYHQNHHLKQWNIRTEAALQQLHGTPLDSWRRGPWAGFTCGLWTLFHLLSQAAGASQPSWPVLGLPWIGTPPWVVEIRTDMTEMICIYLNQVKSYNYYINMYIYIYMYTYVHV